MEYKGKKIKGIEVYDETDSNHIIATITDDKVDTVNGYKLRIIPYVEEKCCE